MPEKFQVYEELGLLTIFPYPKNRLDDIRQRMHNIIDNENKKNFSPFQLLNNPLPPAKTSDDLTKNYNLAYPNPPFPYSTLAVTTRNSFFNPDDINKKLDSLLPHSTSTEVIIAYRWWKLSPHYFNIVNSYYALTSVYTESLWIPGIPMEGIVGANLPSGVHAFNDSLYCDTYYEGGYNIVMVKGEVYLWGKVLCTQYGYRAQYAYPRKLFIPKHCNPDMTTELRNMYGVEVDNV